MFLLCATLNTAHTVRDVTLRIHDKIGKTLGDIWFNP